MDRDTVRYVFTSVDTRGIYESALRKRLADLDNASLG